jgi:hypothetical protein
MTFSQVSGTTTFPDHFFSDFRSDDTFPSRSNDRTPPDRQWSDILCPQATVHGYPLHRLNISSWVEWQTDHANESNHSALFLGSVEPMKREITYFRSQIAKLGGAEKATFAVGECRCGA